MQFWISCRSAVTGAGVIMTLCIWPLLGGCQQYERKPLDISAHRLELGQRVQEITQIEAFIDRLDSAGGQTPDAFSFDDGLTSAEGEVLALFYNPDLRIKRLEAGVALATYETVGLWDDPVFGFDGAEILSPSGPFEFGLTLNFSIPISGRLDVEKSRAGAAYEAQLREIVDAEWRTRAQVRHSWARWSTTIETLDVLREFVGELEAITEIVKQLREVGELNRADERVFAIALANQRVAVLLAQDDSQQQHAALLGLLGLPADASVQLTPGLAATSLPDSTVDHDGLLIERNTTLAVRRAAYQTAERTLELEIRKQIPDIDLGGGYGNEDDDRLLLGVSIPIPVFNANKPAIAEARAARELARGLAETTYQQLSSKLHQAMIRHRGAQQRRAMVTQDVLQRSEEQIAELRRLAELGEVDTLLLLESLTAFSDARLQVLDLLLRENLAAISIAELVGPAQLASPAPRTDTTPNAGEDS